MTTWDDFLTDRDKEHLAATWRKTAPFGLGSTPAVLVIDDYYSVLGLRREPLLESVKTWPMSCGLEGWAAIDKTVALLQGARDSGIPVIYVKGMDTPVNAPWGGSGSRSTAPNLGADELAMANEIVAEIAPREGELVIQKDAPSAFQGTPLKFYLQYHRIDTLVVCGETTSGCVRASVVDGATARYHMGVVGECCFDRTEASHHINLFDMNQKYADILSVAEAVQYFSGLARESSAVALV